MHILHFFDKRSKNVNLDKVGYYPSHNFPAIITLLNINKLHLPPRTHLTSHILTSCLPEGDVAVLGCGTRLIAGSHVPRVIQYPAFFLSGKVHGDINF